VTIVVVISATNGPGSRIELWPEDDDRQREPDDGDGVHIVRSQMLGERAPLGKKIAGTAPIFKPNRSFTWLEKMMTAIPLVNPVTTGAEWYLMIPRASRRRE
jgi:hypothetical protein